MRARLSILALAVSVAAVSFSFGQAPDCTGISAVHNSSPDLVGELDTVRIASGLQWPTFITSAPGDMERLFVIEKPGRIRIIKNGSLLGTDFLNIDPLINTSGERGLLGLAFHPNYGSNGLFYVSYSDNSGRTMLVQYSVSGGDPDIANAGSAVTIFGPLSQPFNNHNGGCIQFSPADGMLYLGLGDGGSGNDPGNRAQNITNNLGKMLRFDVDSPGTGYIPADNPFVGVAGNDEIWAIGLRNPWRFSFDRLTGDMYIGDVGQFAREELDFEPAGAGGRNYGWRCMEGDDCTGLSGCTCNSASLTDPLRDNNQAGGRCSITGGYVYRGCTMPDLRGTYFFGDFCTAKIWSFVYDDGVTQFADRTSELAPGGGLSINQITSFGEDARGELYICDQGGEVFSRASRSPDPHVARASPSRPRAWQANARTTSRVGVAPHPDRPNAGCSPHEPLPKRRRKMTLRPLRTNDSRSSGSG